VSPAIKRDINMYLPVKAVMVHHTRQA